MQGVGNACGLLIECAVAVFATVVFINKEGPVAMLLCLAGDQVTKVFKRAESAQRFREPGTNADNIRRRASAGAEVGRRCRLFGCGLWRLLCRLQTLARADGSFSLGFGFRLGGNAF